MLKTEIISLGKKQKLEIWKLRLQLIIKSYTKEPSLKFPFKSINRTGVADVIWYGVP